MSLFEERSYYQILEISPDASLHDVREAYQRLKHAYSKDSVAMYSLLSEDECSSVLESIEKAYAVLSSESARKDYDRNFDSGFLNPEPVSAGEVPMAAPPSAGGGFFGDSDLLVAPSTALADEKMTIDAPSPIERRMEPSTTYSAPTPTASRPEPTPRAAEPAPERTRATAPREFPPDTDWTGSLLRALREEAGIPIEEMVAQTRISKTYLRAIEDEEYAKLPATVFTRGFVTQIARILKLPGDRLVPGYLARLERAKKPG